MIISMVNLFINVNKKLKTDEKYMGETNCVNTINNNVPLVTLCCQFLLTFLFIFIQKVLLDIFSRLFA